MTNEQLGNYKYINNQIRDYEKLIYAINNHKDSTITLNYGTNDYYTAFRSDGSNACTEKLLKCLKDFAETELASFQKQFDEL